MSKFKNFFHDRGTEKVKDFDVIGVGCKNPFPKMPFEACRAIIHNNEVYFLHYLDCEKGLGQVAQLSPRVFSIGKFGDAPAVIEKMKLPGGYSLIGEFGFNNIPSKYLEILKNQSPIPMYSLIVDVKDNVIKAFRFFTMSDLMEKEYKKVITDTFDGCERLDINQYEITTKIQESKSQLEWERSFKTVWDTSKKVGGQ